MQSGLPVDLHEVDNKRIIGQEARRRGAAGHAAVSAPLLEVTASRGHREPHRAAHGRAKARRRRRWRKRHQHASWSCAGPGVRQAACVFRWSALALLAACQQTLPVSCCGTVLGAMCNTICLVSFKTRHCCCCCGCARWIQLACTREKQVPHAAARACEGGNTAGRVWGRLANGLPPAHQNAASSCWPVLLMFCPLYLSCSLQPLPPPRPGSVPPRPRRSDGWPTWVTYAI